MREGGKGRKSMCDLRGIKFINKKSAINRLFESPFNQKDPRQATLVFLSGI